MGINFQTRRARWGSAVVATLLFMAAWLPWHPARPLLPTADLYTHLSVARHLVRGEGFRNDVTYPLSFAFPFARQLPQPLINRQPGFALLLTIPYLTAARDAELTLVHTRVLQLVLMSLIILLGVRGLQRRNRIWGVVPWFVLLGSSSLWAFGVAWGFEEITVSALLLLLWLRGRRQRASGPDAVSGLLWGGLIMFRLDLFWLPLLWWLLQLSSAEAKARGRGLYLRNFALASLVALTVMSPWLVRNTRLTGQPFFTLQSQAELVKDTRAWPGYQVYRQLKPQPMALVLREDPVPVLRKAARGLKFYWRDSRRFFPPLLLFGFAVISGRAIWRRRASGGEAKGDRSAPAVAFLTFLALCFQYSFFDHSLRHLLVLLPILAWEVAHFAGRDWRLAAAVSLTVILPWAPLPGWQQAARTAELAAQEQPWLQDRELIAAGGIYFFEYSAGPWFLDHPGVWRSDVGEDKIPLLLDSATSR